MGREGEVEETGTRGAIPVFEGGFEIVFEIVDGGEEIVGVGVAGIERESGAKIFFGDGVISAAIGKAGELDQEAGITRIGEAADVEGAPGIVPALELSKGEAAIELEVGRLGRGFGDSVDDFLPLAQIKPLLDLRGLIRGGSALRQGVLRRDGEKQQKKDQAGCRGTARRVQL